MNSVSYNLKDAFSSARLSLISTIASVACLSLTKSGSWFKHWLPNRRYQDKLQGLKRSILLVVRIPNTKGPRKTQHSDWFRSLPT